MPIIKIDYDKKKIRSEDVHKLAVELQKIAGDAMGLPLSRFSVYATANDLAINAAPVEIYIQAGAQVVSKGSAGKYLKTIIKHVKDFKKANRITTPLNISLIRMDWKYELEV